MGTKSYVTEKTSKHVVLHRMAPWDWMETSSYAVTPFVGIYHYGANDHGSEWSHLDASHGHGLMDPDHITAGST